MANFIPTTDSEKATVINTFSGKINDYATLLGLTPTEVTSVKNDAAAFTYWLANADIFEKESRERTSYKNLLRDGPLNTPAGVQPTVPTLVAPPAVVLPGIFARFAATVGRIKLHSNYTDTIGKDLGIAGVETQSFASIANDLKPILKLSLVAGFPQVKYPKGKTSGVRLFCKRGAATDYSDLGPILTAVYIDKRPNLQAGVPERRTYYAWYIKGNDNVGQKGDEFSVVVEG